MKDSTRGLLVGLIVAGLMAFWARRTRLWADATTELDTYDEMQTDAYVVSLSTGDGDLLLSSKYPFFGTEWGQYCPIGAEEDDDDT